MAGRNVDWQGDGGQAAELRMSIASNGGAQMRGSQRKHNQRTAYSAQASLGPGLGREQGLPQVDLRPFFRGQPDPGLELVQVLPHQAAGAPSVSRGNGIDDVDVLMPAAGRFAAAPYRASINEVREISSERKSYIGAFAAISAIAR